MNVISKPEERTVALRHGSGSRAMRRLISETLTRGLSDIGMAPGVEETIGLKDMDDGAALRIGDRWLVMTTDSHVIHPIFFPGGDIGRLAISGTVNDLAMMGATEVLGLSSSLILEDGFPLSDLERIQQSMVEACREARAPIVCGDTKVMGRGELDRIVLNTTGVALTHRVVGDKGLSPGDRLVVTGNIGDHGFAVLAARNQLELVGNLRSDVAPINGLIKVALDAIGDDLVAMKDPTRGGVASTLAEMASKSGVGIVLDEGALPKTDEVRAASELLGIDPLHVANEGKAVIGVRESALEPLLAALRAHPLGRDACCIGRCNSERIGQIVLDTGFGRRLLSELEGEPLPRIC